MRRSRGKGALGVAGLVDAVNQRKVNHLFLSDTADSIGWQCRDCGTIGQGVSLGCPLCESAVRTVELAEQFIAAADNEGAHVDFVSGPSLLDRYEGMGALLRY